MLCTQKTTLDDLPVGEDSFNGSRKSSIFAFPYLKSIFSLLIPCVRTLLLGVKTYKNSSKVFKQSTFLISIKRMIFHITF